MSKFLSRRLMTLILSYQLRRSLGRLGVPLSPRLAPHPVATDFLRDIAIHRKNGRIQFGLPADPFELVFCRRASVTAYLYLLSHCPAEVELFSGACDDGDYPSGARFTPSSRSARAIAIPDRYFILRDGFSAERRLVEADPIPWTSRRDTLVWRGGINGHGIHPQSDDDAYNPRVIPRARMCMQLRSVPGVDALISDALDPHVPLHTLAGFGITGANRAEPEWRGDKFAIDIDGWTNSWSNLIIRMHFGCCVLKVASADGYRQWWYDRLVPWEHFVPVASDMSDFAEKIDWVRSHDREAAEIARRGQALVRTMTLASETRIGAELITANWKLA
jgi:hypothetical protein